MEELLNDVSRDILRIYKNTINPHADLHTRNPIDLLTEIESQIEYYLKEINHIDNLEPGEVIKEEKNRKGEYKKLQREEHIRIESEQNEKKNAELKARMDRVV